MVFPDRTPSPGLLEMAAHYAPVAITPVDLAKGVFEIANYYNFRDLSHVSLSVQREVDDAVEQAMPVELPDVPPDTVVRSSISPLMRRRTA